jgi:hypothetical protein
VDAKREASSTALQETIKKMFAEKDVPGCIRGKRGSIKIRKS